MTRKPPTAVFKCLDNAKLDEYEALTEKLWTEYQERADAKAKELGKDLCSRNSYDGVWITGYAEPDRTVKPPAGWRRDVVTGFIMPHLRSKAGKAIAADLNSISYRPPGTPGLPKLVWGDGFMGPFQTKKIGGDWFAYITVPIGDRTPENTRLSEVDEKLWEPCKMSAYYAALESEGAEK